MLRIARPRERPRVVVSRRAGSLGINGISQRECAHEATRAHQAKGLRLFYVINAGLEQSFALEHRPGDKRNRALVHHKNYPAVVRVFAKPVVFGLTVDTSCGNPGTGIFLTTRTIFSS